LQHDNGQLFEDWLTGRLSDEDHAAFEARLDIDPAFHAAWDAWFVQAPCDLPGLDDERRARSFAAEPSMIRALAGAQSA